MTTLTGATTETEAPMPDQTDPGTYVLGSFHEIARSRTPWDYVRYIVGDDQDYEFDHDAVSDLFHTLVNKALEQHGITLDFGDHVYLEFRSASQREGQVDLIRDVLEEVAASDEFDVPNWPERP